MHIQNVIVVVSAGRLSGPSQRDVRSSGTRGSAAQACRSHPLEYQMYYVI